MRQSETCILSFPRMGMEAPLDTDIENGKIGELGGSVNKEELLESWSITHIVGK